MKHIEVDYHFVRDAYNDYVVGLPHVSTQLQVADTLTKIVHLLYHHFLDRKLMLCDQPRQFEKIFTREYCFLLNVGQTFNGMYLVSLILAYMMRQYNIFYYEILTCIRDPKILTSSMGSHVTSTSFFCV